jgi:hypothetical protein
MAKIDGKQIVGQVDNDQKDNDTPVADEPGENPKGDGKPVAVAAIAIEPIYCPGAFWDCLVRLPQAELEALVLLDATSHEDILSAVKHLRQKGWRHIVVVTADPSYSQARHVLAGGTASDYWDKSYDRSTILAQVKEYVTEPGHGRLAEVGAELHKPPKA